MNDTALVGGGRRAQSAIYGRARARALPPETAYMGLAALSLFMAVLALRLHVSHLASPVLLFTVSPFT